MGVGFNREGYIKYIRYDKPVRYFDFEPQPRLSAFVVANKKDALLPDYARRMIALLVEQGKDVVAEVHPPCVDI
ncbi:hypothetical protein SDC9_204048 [bioreactor metagenome]|uniref:Uncharacterized protein n=1 Tax=bioreactor metagenome TaxID=1076179 RepID=A0A645IZM9_9ZZZZ